MLDNFQQFEAVIAELLDVPLEDLSGYEESLLDFGLDSVQIMTLVGQLEELGIEVSFIDLAAQVELPAWWALIESKQKQPA